MEFDPDSMSTRDVYLKMVSLITPRPIAWVSTLSQTGVANLAPYSFFNGIGANPPSLMFAPVNRRDGSRKDSLLNVENNGQFVVNVVSFEQAESMNQTSADFDSETSEFSACGLTPLESMKVSPPRVAEAKASFECELLQTLHLGTGPAGANLVIGRIVMIHVADEVVTESGEVLPESLDTIGRLGGAGYSRTTDRFDLQRPDPPTAS